MILRHRRGFTLIEVMIVVAIVGILAALALPSYTNYLRRGRISDAVSALSSQRTAMEQFFQDQRTYVGACTAGTVAPPIPDTPHFTFVCSDRSATGYLITANGRGSMNGFIYTVNQANARTSAVPAGSGWAVHDPNDCWVLKQDGSC